MADSTALGCAGAVSYARETASLRRMRGLVHAKRPWAGGPQQSCRNRRVAYIEIELEAVNGMDRAGPFAFLNAASRERLPLEGPRMNPWSFFAPLIRAEGELSVV